LREQDLDPEPPDGKPRIRKGTAVDRRVSVEDKDMRHGRKSKSKRFNGYKGHIACDLDTELIVACGITPANRPKPPAERWRSRTTSLCSTVFENLSPRPRDANDFASASKSSTPSPISHESRDVALATAVSANTSSTFAATPPSSISKPSTAGTPPPPDFIGNSDCLSF
jgi:hypothetical protein